MSNKVIIGMIIGLVGVFGLVIFVQNYVTSSIDDKLEKTALALDAQIAKQDLMLTTIADLSRQSGADEITEKIVVDCAPNERERFDLLLNQLSGTITSVELKELDILFYKCGRFYADRKAVMSARLLREVQIYQENIALRESVVGVDEVLKQKAVNWQQVSEMEMKLSEHFNNLVELQGDIILTLLAGKSRTSPEITSTLEEVSKTRSEMAVLSQQIEKLRTEMRPI